MQTPSFQSAALNVSMVDLIPDNYSLTSDVSDFLSTIGSFQVIPCNYKKDFIEQ